MATLIVVAVSCDSKKQQEEKSNAGIPFGDSLHAPVPQFIPGKVMCAYYDAGGEGVAYHDVDANNNGSGSLNPVDGSYLHSFRINEGVDISYTKKEIDFTENNTFIPEQNMLYVGWTEPGEWIKYTVDVAEAGVYSVNILYTAAENGAFSLSVNGEDKTGSIELISTGYYHHWAKAIGITKMNLEKGTQILTLTTTKSGPTNYAYLEFERVKN